MEHYSRFTDVRTVLRDYRAAEDGSLPFLTQLAKGDPADAEVRAALDAYESLKAHLALAYGPGGVAGPLEVARAREVMAQLEEKGHRTRRAARYWRAVFLGRSASPLSPIRAPQLRRFDPNRET